MSAFSLLRQHILYPNDSLYDVGMKLFREACIRLNFTSSDAEKLFKQGDKAKNLVSFSERLSLLINLSIDLYDKDVDRVLLRYIFQYRKLGDEVPFKLNQWEFLSQINLKSKKKQKIIKANVTEATNVWKINDLKLQKRVLMRAENFYSKTNAPKEAAFYLEKYQELDINIFNKIQVLFRKII